MPRFGPEVISTHKLLCSDRAVVKLTCVSVMALADSLSRMPAARTGFTTFMPTSRVEPAGMFILCTVESFDVVEFSACPYVEDRNDSVATIVRGISLFITRICSCQAQDY